MMIFKANISFLILAALFLHNSESMPSFKRRQVPPDGPTGVIVLPTEEQCITFEHPYCSRFGYTRTRFPNTRGHETIGEAANEFNNFEDLLKSNCSSKIGTLLCFLYFPYCDPRGYVIHPCEDTCIEAHTDECTKLVSNSSVGEWVPHLQCNYTHDNETVYKNINCANGTQPEWKPKPTTAPKPCVGKACDKNDDGSDDDGTDEDTEPELDDNDYSDECAEGTHDCINTKVCEDTLTSYECKCPDGEEGDGRIDGTGCTIDCSKCRIRTTATANTFKRNCYTFAAQVNLTSIDNCDDESESYCAQFAVIQQLDLQTLNTVTNQLVLAPSIPENINTVLSNTCYLCLHLEINQQYLIAGVYKREDGESSYNWEIPGNGLVSKWKKKLDKKLSTWLNNTAEARRSSTTCTVTLN